MLRGSKVILRQVSRADIHNFLVWFNDPEVTQYLSLYLPMTEMAEEKWIEGLSSDTTRVNFVIEAANSDKSKPIGTIGFHNLRTKDRDTEFGIVIGDKQYWSKGYGTEAARLMLKYAFEQLNLNRVTSSVFAFNERSQRMHLKVGFKQEGVKRQGVFVNGGYHDVLLFGILAQEWRDNLLLL